jgi:hypothetical protein
MRIRSWPLRSKLGRNLAKYLLGLSLVATVALPKHSASAQVNGGPAPITVNAVANIYGAGHGIAPDPGGGGAGELPALVSVPVGGQVLKVRSAVGSISADGGVTFNGADGSLGPITVNAWDGISGIRDRSGGFYLVGIFLTDDEPQDPAPAARNFTNHHDAPSMSPALATVFFIGDGHTGTGQTQRFHVPAGATRLFLGIADACGGQGLPGCYGDNLGSLEVTFSIMP